jgi:hypothetical protein
LYEEGKLLAAAEWYQRLSEWHLQHPDWVKE